MKIKKGYTLSQFVDYLDNLKVIDGCDYDYFTAYEDIVNYNNLLKQPLTKEMFVNELEKPKDSKHCDLFNDHLSAINESCDCDLGECKKMDAWQEAEKKVIFEGWTIQHDKISSEKGYNITFGKRWIEFEDILESEFKEINTLSDLFNATDGKLVTKNLTI